MKTAETRHIFIGIKGTVLALDPATGSELWRRELKGSEFVNVVLTDEQLLATTKGEIFGLDKVTGEILWSNPLTGLGRGLVSVAVTNSSSNPIALAAQLKQEEEAAAAAAGCAVIGAAG